MDVIVFLWNRLKVALHGQAWSEEAYASRTAIAAAHGGGTFRVPKISNGAPERLVIVPTLRVIDRAGRELEFSGDGLASLSVMEIVRDNANEADFAVCGGCCSCSTCHVYVDPAFSNRLPPMSVEERDLLEGSSCRKDGSRLSCQLPFRAELDSLTVTIAPEE